jgi:transposase
MSIREIARTFGHSRFKIRQVLAEAVPRPYTLRQPRVKRCLGETFQRVIDEILETDRTAPKKQRHTAKRIFDRLKQEHRFAGGYDAVRRYVNSRRVPTPETFLPIAVDAGQRVECDFGQIEVDFPDGRRSVSILLVTWAYSSALFAIALPCEKTEAILHGTVEAFEFFGCVPRELWWDNPKTVAQVILHGRERELNSKYKALASHYNFSPMFCMPARGNEKPHVEGRVKWLKRNWATPVPQVKDLDKLNVFLRQQCETDRQRTVSGQTLTIGERFEQERRQAASLPRTTFDPCVHESREIDKYQTVAWESNRYSVPRRDIMSTVVVKAYVDRIDIVRGSHVIASHERSYGRGEMILDPLHYLAVLDRKPAYLDHTEVYRNWRLPQKFLEIREYFESRHGRIPGVRQFIQVLQLLAHHSQEQVIQAIGHCERDGVVSAQRIIFRCVQLSKRSDLVTVSGDDRAEQGITPITSRVPNVHVPTPDLSRFDALLSQAHQSHEALSSSPLQTAQEVNREQVVSSLSTTQGGVRHVEVYQPEVNPFETHGCRGTPTIEIQPQATTIADDASRTREAGSGGSRCEPRLLGVSTPPERIGVGFTSFQCFTTTSAYSGVPCPEGTRFF